MKDWKPVDHSCPESIYILAYWERFDCFNVVMRIANLWSNEDGHSFSPPSHYHLLTPPRKV